MKQAQSTGSFKERDNLTPEQAELIALRKKNKQLEMENDILKASGADIRTKRQVIDANKHKYSISAMCKILNISRQTYYYQAKPIENESDLEEIVQEEFIRNRKAYGTRKLKKCLAKRGLQLSRRRIGRIMKRRGLTSTYTIAHFKGNEQLVMKRNSECIRSDLYTRTAIGSHRYGSYLCSRGEKVALYLLNT